MLELSLFRIFLTMILNEPKIKAFIKKLIKIVGKIWVAIASSKVIKTN